MFSQVRQAREPGRRASEGRSHVAPLCTPEAGISCEPNRPGCQYVEALTHDQKGSRIRISGLWPVAPIIHISRSVGPEFGPEDLNWIRRGGGSRIWAADHLSARTAVARTPAPNGQATQRVRTARQERLRPGVGERGEGRSRHVTHALPRSRPAQPHGTTMAITRLFCLPPLGSTSRPGPWAVPVDSLTAQGC